MSDCLGNCADQRECPKCHGWFYNIETHVAGCGLVSWQELFGAHDDEYQKFEPVKDQMPFYCRLTCALIKIEQMGLGTDIYAEHDEVFLVSVPDEFVMSDEDVMYLVRMGVHVSESSDGLSFFC